MYNLVRKNFSGIKQINKNKTSWIKLSAFSRGSISILQNIRNPYIESLLLLWIIRQNELITIVDEDEQHY